MTFTQLLAGQRRSEIGVSLPDDGQGTLGQLVVQSSIPGHTALARDQSSSARLAIPRRQTAYLPRRQSQTFGCTPWLEPSLGHVLNDLESVHFLHRHCYPFCHNHRSLQHPKTAAG